MKKYPPFHEERKGRERRGCGCGKVRRESKRLYRSGKNGGMRDSDREEVGGEKEEGGEG